MTRYEFSGGTSNKFWEIEAPALLSIPIPVMADGTQSSWIVRVRFGRIGTDGKSHYNVFNSEKAANAHYSYKINEKLGKGYKLAKEFEKLNAGVGLMKSVTKSALVYVQGAKPKPNPACGHAQLRKTAERKWACNACGVHIEFDKPQANEPAQEVAQVRRFIDMAALSGA